MAPGGRSARCGDFTSANRPSRASISISGLLVSITSTAKRRAFASVSARCTTFSESARHSSTLMPVFFSNACASGPDSVGASEV